MNNNVLRTLCVLFAGAVCFPTLALAQRTVTVPESQGCPSGYSQIGKDCSKRNRHNRGCQRSFLIATAAAATAAESSRRTCAGKKSPSDRRACYAAVAAGLQPPSIAQAVPGQAAETALLNAS